MQAATGVHTWTQYVVNTNTQNVVNHHFLILAKYIIFLCVLISQADRQNTVEDSEENF